MLTTAMQHIEKFCLKNATNSPNIFWKQKKKNAVGEAVTL